LFQVHLEKLDVPNFSEWVNEPFKVLPLDRMQQVADEKLKKYLENFTKILISK